MAITYTWSILSMDTQKTGGVDEFVVTAHWLCSGDDGTNTATLAGATGFAPKEGAKYSDYSKLKPEQVVAWVQSQMGEERVGEVETDIASQLSIKAAPTPLPW